MLTHELLINLAEKIGDDMLPLYKKLSLSVEQKDNQAYYTTLHEINQRLKSRMTSPDAILPTELSPSQSQLPLPPGEG